MQEVGFGGGCHWCTEAIFDSLQGVSQVKQGWITSTHQNATTPSEAVIVHYNEKIISLAILVEIHLYTHNATSNHTFRDKYRSAVYTFNEVQEMKAQNILKQMQTLFKKPLITKVYPFDAFRLNDEQYLNYYKSNPKKPFCRVRIEPKLQILMEKYHKYINH